MQLSTDVKSSPAPLAPRQDAVIQQACNRNMNSSDMEIDEVSGVIDIDEGAGVLESPEYVEEIDSYLRECEVSFIFQYCSF